MLSNYKFSQRQYEKQKFFNINNNNGEGDEAGEHQNEEMDLDQSLNSEEVQIQA